jgi:hypothetical protein
MKGKRYFKEGRVGGNAVFYRKNVAGLECKCTLYQFREYDERKTIKLESCMAPCVPCESNPFAKNIFQEVSIVRKDRPQSDG